MHDGQYMQSAEFIAVVAFLFAPPLLLAFAVQTILFTKSRIFVRGLVHRAVLGYIATLAVSPLIGFVIHEFAPNSFGVILRVRDVPFGNQSWPVMPLAFLAVCISAIPISAFVIRGTKSIHGVN